MGWLVRDERGIGRGEVAESQLETPFLAAFMIACAIGLFIFQIKVGNPSYTLAAAISMVAFGLTVVRVEIGLYILVIAMLLSPEITAGAVGAHDERGLNIRYDDILIVIIFLGVLLKLAFEGRLVFWRPSPINAGIFFYYGICIVSTLLALNTSVQAWDKDVAFFVMLKMLEFYMIFFMVGLAINNVRDIRKQLVVFFAVAFIVSVYAIISVGTHPRVSAPFEAGGTEPNTLGGYLMIIMCVAVGLFFHAPTKKLKLTFLVIGIASFLPFLMTLSRASYVSLLVALTALSLIGRRPAIFIVVCLILALSPIMMPDDVLDRVNYTFQRGSGVPIEIAGHETNLQVDKSTYERIYIWKKVRHNLRVWPWFGGGISWETVLDSQYARVIIETGIFGILAFAFMLYRIVRTSREAYRWSHDWVCKGLALGVTATAIGLIVHGLGTISFLIVRIMEPFWFLLALTIVAREIALADYQGRLALWRMQVAAEKQAEAKLECGPVAPPEAVTPSHA